VTYNLHWANLVYIGCEMPTKYPLYNECCENISATPKRACFLAGALEEGHLFAPSLFYFTMDI
jgi:hypothetical protein